METVAHEFALMAVIGPALNAIAFVFVMSLVREPARQQLQRDPRRRRRSCLPERRTRLLGVPVHRRGHRGGLSRAAVVSLDRRRVAAAHGVGRRPSPLRQPDLALDAAVVARLRGARRADRDLVPARRAVRLRALAPPARSRLDDPARRSLALLGCCSRSAATTSRSSLTSCRRAATRRRSRDLRRAVQQLPRRRRARRRPGGPLARPAAAQLRRSTLAGRPRRTTGSAS